MLYYYLLFDTTFSPYCFCPIQQDRAVVSNTGLSDRAQALQLGKIIQHIFVMVPTKEVVTTAVSFWYKY